LHRRLAILFKQQESLQRAGGTKVPRNLQFQSFSRFELARVESLGDLHRDGAMPDCVRIRRGCRILLRSSRGAREWNLARGTGCGKQQYRRSQDGKIEILANVEA
jgi:hypothetical protein